jgi:hypothetical protein
MSNIFSKYISYARDGSQKTAQKSLTLETFSLLPGTQVRYRAWVIQRIFRARIGFHGSGAHRLRSTDLNGFPCCTTRPGTGHHAGHKRPDAPWDRRRSAGLRKRLGRIKSGQSQRYRAVDLGGKRRDCVGVISPTGMLGNPRKTTTQESSGPGQARPRGHGWPGQARP